MKTDKILILFIFIALEFSCNKTDELNSPITVRSPHEVMITSDVETIVLKKLKNPSIGCISLFRMYSVNLSNQTYI